jgi:hypothetical protein
MEKTMIISSIFNSHLMDENYTDILDVYYIVSDQISIVLLIKKNHY